MDDPSRPIFLQLAERLEGEIISGLIAEESPIPSINELAAFHRINPATALKAVNQLVEQGTLYKKRGIGMFVVGGACNKLAAKYRTKFQDDYVVPLLKQGKKLGISQHEIIQMIEKGKQ